MLAFPFPLTLCLVAILLPIFPTLTSSIPIQLSPRSEFCSNAQTTVAGTMFHRRSLVPHEISPLHPRSAHAQDTVWCISGSRTYLHLRITMALASNAVIPVLSDAYNSVYAHLHSSGDGLVAGGGFKFTVNKMMVDVWNTNNHQLSWGVLGSTLWGLTQYMQTNGEWGSAVFQVFDGSNLVGSGMLSQVRSG